MTTSSTEHNHPLGDGVPEQNPGNPNIPRPPVGQVSLQGEHSGPMPLDEPVSLVDSEHDTEGLYGLMAEYEDAPALAEATRRARGAGYQKVEAYTPHPDHEVQEAIGMKRNLIPYIVAAGGIAGLLGGYALQWWTQVVAYPLNIGGRPLNSAILFMPVTFEMTILLAAFGAVFGMLMLNGLPLPYHPVFNVDRFARASRDRFFLVIEADDPNFNYAQTRSFMASTGAREVMDVPE